MSSAKQFHMGDIKAWLDKKSGEYLPYSEMSKDELQKCLHIAQKREIQQLNKAAIFNKLIVDIDEEVEKRGFELQDIPEDYYKNTRMLQTKIKINKLNA